MPDYFQVVLDRFYYIYILKCTCICPNDGTLMAWTALSNIEPEQTKMYMKVASRHANITEKGISKLIQPQPNFLTTDCRESYLGLKEQICRKKQIGPF